MCARIVRIETAGPGLKARRLVFDDGSEPRVASACAVKQLALEEGADIPRASLESSLEEIEYGLAKDRALMLLGYREHSASELMRKLRDSGYPPGVARAVVDRLMELELVDDARFAAAWVRSRLNAGYGERRIARELGQRGIDADIVQAAIAAQSAESGDDVTRARTALRGVIPGDKSGRERAIRRLVARGFSLSVALQAVEVADPDELLG